jgi:hypothetical protein
VDMSREVRRVLLELRDEMIMKAFERGEAKGPKLVFPSATGGTLDGINLYHRDLFAMPRSSRVTSDHFSFVKAQLRLAPDPGGREPCVRKGANRPQLDTGDGRYLRAFGPGSGHCLG